MNCRAKNILVTGGDGQLGRSLHRIVERGSGKRYRFTEIGELDITDGGAVREYVNANNIGVIVNCAAYTNVDGAEQQEQLADAVNNRAVANLAAAALDSDALLIHISTDYVFNGEASLPYREDDSPAPYSVYGVTKRRGEEALIASGCRYMIFRTAWLYSEYGKNFLKTMESLMESRDSVSVVFDQVGTPTYAADLAAAIFKVIEEERFECGLYHYSNEGVCSWYDFAVEIASMGGYDCKVEPCHSNEFPSKVKRPHYSVLDKTKVKRVLGVEVPYWRNSLGICIENLRRN